MAIAQVKLTVDANVLSKESGDTELIKIDLKQVSVKCSQNNKTFCGDNSLRFLAGDLFSAGHYLLLPGSRQRIYLLLCQITEAEILLPDFGLYSSDRSSENTLRSGFFFDPIFFPDNNIFPGIHDLVRQLGVGNGPKL